MRLAAFFHKNHRPQVIAQAPAWTDLVFRDGAMLNRKRFTARRAGILATKLYLPLKVRFTPAAAFALQVGGRASAVVRVRLVREPFKGDPINPTAYDERTLVPGGDGYARLSFSNPIATEAERGRRYRWQAQVVGPATVETTGTHYAEWAIL